MRILVCIKRVAEPGATIPIAPDGTTIAASSLQHSIGPHDECAIAEAIRLTERHGGTVAALCLGPRSAEEQLRQTLAVGVDAAVLVVSNHNDPDAQQTASALLSTIESIEQVEGPFDVILFGNESADSGGFQVGIRVAHGLSRPVISGVKQIEIDGEFLTAGRESQAGTELFRLPLPAVLAVRDGISLPRYPTLGGRLAAKRATIDYRDASLPPKQQRTIRLETRRDNRGRETEVLTDVPEVVGVFERLGIL